MPSSEPELAQALYYPFNTKRCDYNMRASSSSWSVSRRGDSTRRELHSFGPRMDRSGRGAAGGAVAGGPAGAVGPPVLPAGRQRGTPARAGAALAVLPAGARRVLLPLPAARRRAPAVLAAGARHRAPALVVAPHASLRCLTGGRVFKFRVRARRAEQVALVKRGYTLAGHLYKGLGRGARELSRAAGRLRERTRRAMRDRWADTRARVRY
jgi:hypothetical protein